MKRRLEYYINGFVAILALFVAVSILINEKSSHPFITEEDNEGEIVSMEKKPSLQNNTLSQICIDTKWEPGLYINCTNILPLPNNPPGTANPQGIANTVNVMLICLRWAIDGGLGFVLPRIAVRSQKDIRYFDEWADYEYLFDTNHLKETLARECPQLKIVDSDFNVTKVIRTERIALQRYSYGEYKIHVNDIIQKNNINPSALAPIAIWENEQLFNWRFDTDSMIALKTLRTAVKPNGIIRSISNSLSDILPLEYIGFHLRLEADMVVGSYTEQISFFLKHYEKLTNPSKYIYVSLGDRNVEDRFRSEMNTLELDVISKWSLSSINATLEEEMKALRFDQLAYLEWSILARSSYFFGCGESSFSFSIASERGNGNITECRCSIYGEVYSGFLCCV